MMSEEGWEERSGRVAGKQEVLRVASWGTVRIRFAPASHQPDGMPYYPFP